LEYIDLQCKDKPFDVEKFFKLKLKALLRKSVSLSWKGCITEALKLFETKIKDLLNLDNFHVED